MVRRGTWEYVERSVSTGVIALIPVTDSGRLVLVEQERPPVGASVVEIPAGLVGDRPGEERESLEAAARRELVEETGYEAASLELVAHGPPSAGVSDEELVVFLATGLRKVGDGGGDEHEDIRVHEVELSAVEEWLGRRASEGAKIDLKIWMGLHFARAAAGRARDAENPKGTTCQGA